MATVTIADIDNTVIDPATRPGVMTGRNSPGSVTEQVASLAERSIRGSASLDEVEARQLSAGLDIAETFLNELENKGSPPIQARSLPEADVPDHNAAILEILKEEYEVR